MPSDRGTTHLDDVSPSESFASNLGLLFSKVREKNADSDWRDLHALEKHTLALNELAVAQGAGFFMFLPNRDSLKSFPKDERLPLSRRFESPGAQYAEMVFMRFAWDERAKQDFASSSHRERLLKANFLQNPPPSDVPLYAIQGLPHVSAINFITPFPSFTLYCDPVRQVWYIARTDAIQQIWDEINAEKKPTKRGKTVAPLAPGDRLPTCQYLSGGGDSTRSAASERMQEYRCESLDEVYQFIRDECRPQQRVSSFTTSELWRYLPRTRQAEGGIPFGTPVTPQSQQQDDPDTAAASGISSNAPQQTTTSSPGNPGAGPKTRRHKTHLPPKKF